MWTIFYANDFVKFIHDQFFERGRNVMIIVYNRNTSTRNPGSDVPDIFRQQSPTWIRTVKKCIVQLPSLTTLPGNQRPGIYYSGINTLLFIIVVSEVGQFSNFFGREKICFLFSREDIWRVVAFNGVLIYFGSYLPYLFSRLPIISGFFLY